MKFDGANRYDAQKARCYLEKLIEKGKKFELTEKLPNRTTSQNALFHVWIAVFADFVGYESREDCKRDVKRHLLGMEECVNHLTGEIEKRDYETHTMTTKQMGNLMDRFKTFALNEYGCYLPYAGDDGYSELMAQYYGI
jgi:hypothetical protein